MTRLGYVPRHVLAHVPQTDEADLHPWCPLPCLLQPV
jgi:hypothetical protein